MRNYAIAVADPRPAMTETWSHAAVATYTDAVAAARSLWRATGRRVTVRSAYADGHPQIHRPWHTVLPDGSFVDTNTNSGVPESGTHA